MAKPFESHILDMAYNLDAGFGLRLVQTCLYALAVVVIILLYTATQFFGLRSPEAMEYGQLGRNLLQEKAMVTQVVRPATMRFLINNTGQEITDEKTGESKTIGGNPQLSGHPDIIHPPGYPAVLAAWYSIFGVEFKPSYEGKWAPELIIIVLCHILTVLSGLLVWGLGRQLFDNRVGLLGMTIFFLSNTVWATSISGTTLPLALFLTLAATYASLKTVHHAEQTEGRGKRTFSFLCLVLFSIALVLTRYGGLVLIPSFFLFLGFGLPRHGWRCALLFLLLVGIGVAPWFVRNNNVSGSYFGFALHSTLIGTGPFPDTSYERTLAPSQEDIKLKKIIRGLRVKWSQNTAQYYTDNTRNLGDGLLICFFATTFFYRFVRKQVRVFRWCILLGMILLLGIAGLFGSSTIGLLYLFWPVVILYGLAFFYLLLDWLDLELPIQRLGITSLVVLLSTAPLVIAIVQKGSYPYPPYWRPTIVNISSFMEPDEVLATDMPWATAWYGDRTSLYLPQTLDEFYEINDFIHPVHGIYFTTLTTNLPYVRYLTNGPEQTWFPIMLGRMPEDFPLSQGFPIMNGDQLFVTDKERLENPNEE